MPERWDVSTSAEVGTKLCGQCTVALSAGGVGGKFPFFPFSTIVVVRSEERVDTVWSKVTASAGLLQYLKQTTLSTL